MLDKINDAVLTLRGVKSYEKFFRKSQYFTNEKITYYKNKYLTKLLTHCYYNIPWYSESFRKYGVNISSLNPFDELLKLPILTKKEIQDNHSQFCLFAATKKSQRFTTSGTTGEPLVAYTSNNQWIVEQAMIWRQWKWANYSFRDRMAIFRSYSPKNKQPKFKVDHIKNWAFFSVFHMDDNTVSEYVKFLTKWKPRYLRGYPSSLFLLAQHALKYGWNLPDLKGAFVASESLPIGFRELIKDAFGIEVFDHYGQAEITCMFHDCEKHEGLHLDWEYGHVELLKSDNSSLNRVIATNLHNYTMPLLRYDTGDLVDGGWYECSCGRTSPLISSILGRKDDFLVAKDGSNIPTVNIYTYFSKLSKIRRFQIVQDTPGILIINVLFWDGHHSTSRENSSTIQAIISDFKSMSSLKVVIPESPDWIQSREGKFSTCIQKIKS